MGRAMRQAGGELDAPHGVAPAGERQAGKAEQAPQQRQREQAERAKPQPIAADPPEAEPGQDNIGPENCQQRHEPGPERLPGERQPGTTYGSLQPGELGIRILSGHHRVVLILGLHNLARHPTVATQRRVNPLAYCSQAGRRSRPISSS
jgi:hypothetical protein